MVKIFFLIFGGSLGTLSRYFLSGFVHKFTSADFPYGTMVVNLLGCLVLGFLVALSDKKFLLSPDMRVFLMIGFCGAFTTFSTFMLETANLIQEGNTLRAFWNVMLSVFVGFLILRLGLFLGEML